MRSPPLALARLVGAAGRVQRVELRPVAVRQREVEDAGVLLDALAVRRLREDDEVALQAPAHEDLRRRAPDAIGDPLHAVVAEMAAGAERAVGLEQDAALLTSLQERAPVLERAELHLVD